jgi:hypothetical protein
MASRMTPSHSILLGLLPTNETLMRRSAHRVDNQHESWKLPEWFAVLRLLGTVRAGDTDIYCLLRSHNDDPAFVCGTFLSFFLRLR